MLDLNNKDNLNRYDVWQTFVAMGINIALFSRSKQWKNEPYVFDYDVMIKMGMVEYDEQNEMKVFHFNDDSNSFLKFIQKQLNADFYDALNWTLDFIKRTPPDDGEDNGCRCEDGECDHEHD